MAVETFRERLRIDTKVAELVLTQFIQNELYKVGFKKAVLGLSGGIDSALSCYLAVKALGAENVLAVRMPYKSSSEDSLSHADLIIQDLGIPSETVDITAMVDGCVAQSAGMNDYRKGNVMSRTRMIVLYDRSMAGHSLVVGTSNKTELLLGYGTIFGDLASAVNPIGDLYKTQIRQLSRAMGVPEVIINKPPSADLIPDQTDESDLGFTYDEVDQLLYLMIDERYSVAEAVQAGFSADLIQRVMKRVQFSQFKRTMPIIPKISSRSVGHDFRYLRDWGV